MSLRLGTNVIAGSTIQVGQPYNVGQIIESNVPLTDAGLHLLDGALISGSGSYADFVTYIAGLVSTYPDLFDTEANWQTAVTTYGVCGKFVYDSVNNTVRLPKITGIIEGTTDLTALGDLVEAGLPNITGTLASDFSKKLSGAFYEDTASFPGNGGSGTDIVAGFDASRSSSIYGNSTTVQPQAIKVLYYIVIATSTKTDIQVDIDEIATDLNGKADVDLSNINASQSARNTIVSWGRNFTAINTVVESNLSGTSTSTYNLGFTDNKVKMGYFSVYVDAIASGGSGVIVESDCFINNNTSVLYGCVSTNNGFGNASYICIPFITEITVKTLSVKLSRVTFLGYQ